MAGVEALWLVREKSISSRTAFSRAIYKAIWRLSELMLGFYIPQSVTFSGPPCFPHGLTGIFIAGDAKIGKNCVIFQQVTIGSNTLIDSAGFGAPTIGDDCYFGAGAKIIGGITVGHRVRVGANSVLVKDVPENSVVISKSEYRIRESRQNDNRFWRCPNGRWEYFSNGSWIPATPEEREELEISRK